MEAIDICNFRVTRGILSFLTNYLSRFMTNFFTNFLMNFFYKFFNKFFLQIFQRFFFFFDELFDRLYDEFFDDYLISVLTYNHCKLWDRSTFDLVSTQSLRTIYLFISLFSGAGYKGRKSIAVFVFLFVWNTLFTKASNQCLIFAT